MITRFRVEAEHVDREKLIDQLSHAAMSIISSMRSFNVRVKGQEGKWECTSDVISGKPGEYKGRMVLVYHPFETR